jgi:hypothetical protein
VYSVAGCLLVRYLATFGHPHYNIDLFITSEITVDISLIFMSTFNPSSRNIGHKLRNDFTVTEKCLALSSVSLYKACVLNINIDLG